MCVCVSRNIANGAAATSADTSSNIANGAAATSADTSSNIAMKLLSLVQTLVLT